MSVAGAVRASPGHVGSFRLLPSSELRGAFDSLTALRKLQLRVMHIRQDTVDTISQLLQLRELLIFVSQRDAPEDSGPALLELLRRLPTLRVTVEYLPCSKTATRGFLHDFARFLLGVFHGRRTAAIGAGRRASAPQCAQSRAGTADCRWCVWLPVLTGLRAPTL